MSRLVIGGDSTQDIGDTYLNAQKTAKDQWAAIANANNDAAKTGIAQQQANQQWQESQRAADLRDQQLAQTGALSREEMANRKGIASDQLQAELGWKTADRDLAQKKLEQEGQYQQGELANRNTATAQQGQYQQGELAQRTAANELNNKTRQDVLTAAEKQRQFTNTERELQPEVDAAQRKLDWVSKNTDANQDDIDAASEQLRQAQQKRADRLSGMGKSAPVLAQYMGGSGNEYIGPEAEAVVRSAQAKFNAPDQQTQGDGSTPPPPSDDEKPQTALQSMDNPNPTGAQTYTQAVQPPAQQSLGQRTIARKQAEKQAQRDAVGNQKVSSILDEAAKNGAQLLSPEDQRVIQNARQQAVQSRGQYQIDPATQAVIDKANIGAVAKTQQDAESKLAEDIHKTGAGYDESVSRVLAARDSGLVSDRFAQSFIKNSPTTKAQDDASDWVNEGASSKDLVDRIHFLKAVNSGTIDAEPDNPYVQQLLKTGSLAKVMSSRTGHSTYNSWSVGNSGSLGIGSDGAPSLSLGGSENKGGGNAQTNSDMTRSKDPLQVANQYAQAISKNLDQRKIDRNALDRRLSDMESNIRDQSNGQDPATQFADPDQKKKSGVQPFVATPGGQAGQGGAPTAQPGQPGGRPLTGGPVGDSWGNGLPKTGGPGATFPVSTPGGNLPVAMNARGEPQVQTPMTVQDAQAQSAAQDAAAGDQGASGVGMAVLDKVGNNVVNNFASNPAALPIRGAIGAYNWATGKRSLGDSALDAAQTLPGVGPMVGVGRNIAQNGVTGAAKNSTLILREINEAGDAANSKSTREFAGHGLNIAQNAVEDALGIAGAAGAVANEGPGVTSTSGSPVEQAPAQVWGTAQQLDKAARVQGFKNFAELQAKAPAFAEGLQKVMASESGSLSVGQPPNRNGGIQSTPQGPSAPVSEVAPARPNTPPASQAELVPNPEQQAPGQRRPWPEVQSRNSMLADNNMYGDESGGGMQASGRLQAQPAVDQGTNSEMLRAQIDQKMQTASPQERATLQSALDDLDQRAADKDTLQRMDKRYAKAKAAPQSEFQMQTNGAPPLPPDAPFNPNNAKLVGGLSDQPAPVGMDSKIVTPDEFEADVGRNPNGPNKSLSPSMAGQTADFGLPDLSEKTQLDRGGQIAKIVKDGGSSVPEYDDLPQFGKSDAMIKASVNKNMTPEQSASLPSGVEMGMLDQQQPTTDRTLSKAGMKAGDVRENGKLLNPFGGSQDMIDNALKEQGAVNPTDSNVSPVLNLNPKVRPTDPKLAKLWDKKYGKGVP